MQGNYQGRQGLKPLMHRAAFHEIGRLRHMGGKLGIQPREYGAAHGIELATAVFSLPFDLLNRVESGAEFDLYLLDV